MSDIDYENTALLRAEHPVISSVGIGDAWKPYDVTFPLTIRVWAMSASDAPDEAESLLRDEAADDGRGYDFQEFVDTIFSAAGGSCDVEPYTPEVPAEPVPEDPHHVDGTWVGHGAAS